jgi:predicted flap endonuclease-1-like 5' DNA nuclease
MASLLSAGIATDLEDAYQKARNMMGHAEKAKVDEQVAAKMKAAEQAKAKAEVNVPKAGRDAKPGKRKGTMDDTLKEIADKLFK